MRGKLAGQRARAAVRAKYFHRASKGDNKRSVSMICANVSVNVSREHNCSLGASARVNARVSVNVREMATLRGNCSE